MNKLDEAKINLKSVLKRLEEVVDAKLAEGADKGSLATEVADRIKTLEGDILNLNNDIKDKKEEMDHLREENSKLQAEIGQIQQQNFKLQNKNAQALKKVDNIIGEVKSYMSNHEMF